jgi:hypothetical protein
MQTATQPKFFGVRKPGTFRSLTASRCTRQHLTPMIFHHPSHLTTGITLFTHLQHHSTCFIPQHHIPCEVQGVWSMIESETLRVCGVRSEASLYWTASLIQPPGFIYLFHRNSAGCEICHTIFAGFKLPVPCKILPTTWKHLTLL